MALSLEEADLLRGWIERLPFPTLAQLYTSHDDPLQTRQDIDRLRAQLALKARRCGRPEWVGCWREEPPAAAPGDEEEDLVGAGPSALNVWQARAMAALERLQALADPRPTLADPLDLWLPEAVARRLARAGFEPLAAVHERATQAGPHWWRSCRGVGAQAAQAVETLFQSMGLEPGPLALPAPLDRGLNARVRALWEGQPALDGREGLNRERRRRCQIAADNDYQAILAWLSLRDPAIGTTRIYRREVERCLLWCLLKRHKAFSSLDSADCAAYLKFLAHPDPDWLGPYGATRGSESWKPFRQRRRRGSGEPQTGLSLATRHGVRTILNGLCDWL